MIDSTDRGGAEATTSRFDTGATEPRHAEPSIGSLLKELRDETTLLVRQEVALARTEISEKFNKIARNTGYLGAGALVAYSGLTFLLLALTAGIYVAFDAAGLDEHGLWAAPLIVGAIVSLIGLSMVLKGKNTLQSTSPVPERTIETMKENKEWVREKV